jgi:hypothetical protein
MRWGIPVLEACEAVNDLAEKGGCDPVRLLATTFAAVLVNYPESLITAMRSLDAYGFDLRQREPRKAA